MKKRKRKSKRLLKLYKKKFIEYAKEEHARLTKIRRELDVIAQRMAKKAIGA